MVRVKREAESVTGIALSAVAGLGIGIVGGMILREFLGDIGTERVRKVVRRRREPDAEESEDPDRVKISVERALDEHPDVADLQSGVEALGDGIFELTGTAPDAVTRQLAGEIARGVPGADVVVNRILVDGIDRLSPEPTTPPDTG